MLADPLLEGWAARLLGPAKAYGGLRRVRLIVKDKEQTATLEILVEELGIGAWTPRDELGARRPDSAASSSAGCWTWAM